MESMRGDSSKYKCPVKGILLYVYKFLEVFYRIRRITIRAPIKKEFLGLVKRKKRTFLGLLHEKRYFEVS